MGILEEEVVVHLEERAEGYVERPEEARELDLEGVVPAAGLDFLVIVDFHERAEVELDELNEQLEGAIGDLQVALLANVGQPGGDQLLFSVHWSGKYQNFHFQKNTILYVKNSHSYK